MVDYKLTPEELARVRQKAKENGFDISSNAGSAIYHGVHIDYMYVLGRLQISITSKPWVMPEAWIEGQIYSTLDKWKDGQ